MRNGEAFLRALDRKAKVFAPGARATFEANLEVCSWLLDPLARWAEIAFGPEVFDVAAHGYAEYCVAVAKAKRAYEKEGRYAPECIPQIVAQVYDREDYMVPYMWAAILIYPFWPSMVHHIALFRDEFVRRLPENAAVLEIASGHGVLSLLAAEERPDLCLEGVDISPPAVEVANRLLTASGHTYHVRFRVEDVLNLNGCAMHKRFQGIISAMLAEHLSNPRPLFALISDRISADGQAFFSTALESPQRDHVFEFKQESEPLLMAEAAGLRVSRLLSDASPIPEGSRFVPRATAMILRSHRSVHRGPAQRDSPA